MGRMAHRGGWANGCQRCPGSVSHRSRESLEQRASETQSTIALAWKETTPCAFSVFELRTPCPPLNCKVAFRWLVLI